MQLLLDAGADVNAVGTSVSFTPLHIAAAKGHVAVLACLIARKADVRVMDAEGRAPLHIAGESGQQAAVESLLRAKVPGDQKQKRTDRTAMHLAAMKDHPGVLKTLLAHGAAVDALDSEGQSALDVAAGEGSLQAARALIAGKANINLATTSGKSTPLHLAVAADEIEMVKFLLANKANPNAKNDDGLTPYDLANLAEMKQIAEMLHTRARP